MKKTPSVWMRNYDTDYLCRDEVVPGSEWVLAGEGRATRKWDGTPCLVRDGRMFKRLELKPGAPPPCLFEPCGEVDPNTGKQVGWVPVDPTSKGDRPFFEALELWDLAVTHIPYDGTYELIGPKINGNKENVKYHLFQRHGVELLPNFPRTFEGMRQWFEECSEYEGVVFHHEDGIRMAKVKRKDFGLPWPAKSRV